MGVLSRVLAGPFARLRKRRARVWFPLPTVLLLLVLFVFPALYTLYLSFHDFLTASLSSAVFAGGQNYVRLVGSDARFWPSVVRTMYFAGLAVAIEVVLGTIVALSFNREFPGKGLVRTLILLPMVATPVAVSMVWMMMFDPVTGILNYTLRLLNLPTALWVASPATVIPSLVLVDVWQWTPLITLIVLAGLTILPLEPYEAALIDGASWFQVLWHITLPLLRPYIVVAALFRAIDAIKTFDVIYVITGGGPRFTSETLNMYTYLMAFQYFRLGYASTILVFLFVLVFGTSLVLIQIRRSE